MAYLFFYLAACAYASENMVITNVTGRSVTVTFTTIKSCSGKIQLFKDRTFIREYLDDRGSDFTGHSHHITAGNLTPDTWYQFSISFGETLDDNNGQFYQISTGADLIPVGSIQPAGKVLLCDEYTPARDSIVYIHVSSNADSTISAPLSSLVDTNGFWYVELSNIRTSDSMNSYVVSDQHTLHIAVSGDQSIQIEAPVMDNEGGTRLYDPIILK
jgi:hypothetical protein